MVLVGRPQYKICRLQHYTHFFGLLVTLRGRSTTMRLSLGLWFIGVSVCFVFVVLTPERSNGQLSVHASRLLCEARDYTHTVKRHGCSPKTVTVKACLGTCLSKQIVLDHAPFFLNDCQCCSPAGTKRIAVTLNCPSSFSSTQVWVPSVTGCECKICSWLHKVKEARCATFSSGFYWYTRKKHVFRLDRAGWTLMALLKELDNKRPRSDVFWSNAHVIKNLLIEFRSFSKTVW